MSDTLSRQDVIDTILSEEGNEPRYPEWYAEKILTMDGRPEPEIADVKLARGELGELLKLLRQGTGETRRDVAELTHIGKYRIEAYERGKAFPDVRTLNRLLKHYGYAILIVKEVVLDGKKKRDLF